MQKGRTQFLNKKDHAMIYDQFCPGTITVSLLKNEGLLLIQKIQKRGVPQDSKVVSCLASTSRYMLSSETIKKLEWVGYVCDHASKRWVQPS